MNRETDFPDGRLEVGVPNIAYRYVHGAGGPQDELWIELRLDADWVAAHLVEVVDGEPVIAEVRLLPYEDRPERCALLGPGARTRPEVPASAIPLDKLRALRADDVLETTREHAEQWHHDAEYLEELLADFGLGPLG